MASVQLWTLWMLLVMPDWVTITSAEQGEAPTTDVENMQSTPGNMYGHQRSSAGRHGNHRHSNQQRREPAYQLQTVHHRHIVASDKPLVRRKRIRRDGSTPVNQTPALEPAPPSQLPTGHRHPLVKLLSDKSKLKPVGLHGGKIHRRRLARRRWREHSLSSLDAMRQGFDDHNRDRATPPRAVIRRGGSKTSVESHRRRQKMSDPRPLIAGHRHTQVTRSGKSSASKPGIATTGFPGSISDEIHAHPAAVHHIGVLPRRRTPASGSGERRRRLQKSSDRLHHGDVGVGISRPLTHGMTAPYQYGSGPHVRTNDGKKKSSGGRSKRSRDVKKLTKSLRRSLHHMSRPHQVRSSAGSSEHHLARMTRRRAVRGRHG